MDPDHALVEGLKRGEPDALHQTYERHGERVQRLCRRLLGRAADAEDAAQDVFVRLLERARSFDGRARFSTWLHRLTVNTCLHRIERERLRRGPPLPADGDEPADARASPLDAAARAEAGERLERLLGRLTAEHRAVLVLRELEQLSYREIALTLGIPEGTVMSRLSRARESLLHLLGAPEQRAPVPAVPPRPTLHAP